MKGALILAVVLASCMPNEDQPQDKGELVAQSCEAAGGIVTAGLAGPVCAQVTKDAGKACRANSQCEGFCLAESKTCTPHSPYFGCFEVLEAVGASAMLCVD
ncbi:MAG: hypothetical protein WBA92_12565 [Pseudorhodobacter sp.]